MRRQLLRAIARKTTEEMHPSCRHRRRLDVAEIGDQALTGHARRSFDADVTHPCRAHQDTVSTRSVRRLRPVSGQVARRSLIAPASAAVQAATMRSSTLLYARRAFLSIPLGSLGTVAVRGKAYEGWWNQHVTATAGPTPRWPPKADFAAPSSDDVDELGRSRGSQMTSHTRSIGHGRRERGGGRWKQHGAPLETFSRLACQSEMALAHVITQRAKWRGGVKSQSESFRCTNGFAGSGCCSAGMLSSAAVRSGIAAPVVSSRAASRLYSRVTTKHESAHDRATAQRTAVQLNKKRRPTVAAQSDQF